MGVFVDIDSDIGNLAGILFDLRHNVCLLGVLNIHNTKEFFFITWSLRPVMAAGHHTN
jgi:hypothetical protein